MAADPMSDLRAKILSESLEITNEPKFGYFGFAGPLCIGDDSYAPRLMKKAPVEGDGDGEPIRNIQTGGTKKGMHPNVFFSFAPPLCIDDPFQDAWIRDKKGKVAQVDPDACFKPAGRTKYGANKLGYEYVPHMDTAKDPIAIKEALDGVLPARQIYGAPLKKGGGGILTGGVLFGFGEDRNPVGEPACNEMSDDYDAAKKLRKKELEEHMKLLQEMPFKSGAYGNNNFSSNTDTYGCDQPSHIPRDPELNKVKPYPHEAPFRPSHPSKKGMLKGLMGEYPEWKPDPDAAGFLMKKQPVEDAPPAFRIGAPNQNFKPTPSVTTMVRNMRSERPSSFARPLL